MFWQLDVNFAIQCLFIVEIKVPISLLVLAIIGFYSIYYG